MIKSWNASRLWKFQKKTSKKNIDANWSYNEFKRRTWLKKFEKFVIKNVLFSIFKTILRNWIHCHLLNFSNINWHFHQYNFFYWIRTIWISIFVVKFQNFFFIILIFLLTAMKSEYFSKLISIFAKNDCNNWK